MKLNKVYYTTIDGLTVPLGELKTISITEPRQEAEYEYPDIKLWSESLSLEITPELRKKDKKTWVKIFQMPKYKVTEWAFPKKKKRGSIRRKRKIG